MKLPEIIETFEKREEWVVKNSMMDEAIESALDILKCVEEGFFDETETVKYYRYDKENHRLENLLGNDVTTHEILDFINGEKDEISIEKEK